MLMLFSEQARVRHVVRASDLVTAGAPYWWPLE